MTYAVSWVLLGRLRTDLSPTPGPRGAPLADLRDGIRYVARHPLFRTLTGWAFLTNLTINALFTVAILRMVEGGVDPWQIGLVEAAAAAAGILGAVLAPWVIDRVPTGWLTIAVAWSPLPLVIPMATWAHPAVVAGALALVVLLNPIGNAGMSSYRLTVTPDDLVGPGPVGHPVRLDGVPAAGPAARRRPARRARRLPRPPGGRTALRPGGAAADDGAHRPLGPPPGAVADRRPGSRPDAQGAGRRLRSGRQAAWIPVSPAAPPAGSKPSTP